MGQDDELSAEQVAYYREAIRIHAPTSPHGVCAVCGARRLAWRTGVWLALTVGLWAVSGHLLAGLVVASVVMAAAHTRRRRRRRRRR